MPSKVYEYPLYISKTNTLITVLKSAILTNLKKYGETYLIIYGLSRRVYYILANAYIKALIRHKIETQGNTSQVIQEIYEEKSSDKLENVFVISNEDILKLLNVRLLLENQLTFLNKREQEKIYKLKHQGLNLYVWRISLRRGKTLGIYNIPFLNIKTRTRTLLNDILRTWFNNDFQTFIRKTIFVIMVEDPNLTISTVESILSFLSSKTTQLGKNKEIIIPPIIIGLSNIVIPVSDEEYLNRLGGIIKNFAGRIDAATYYTGMRFNPHNYPPVISDNIIDLDRDAVEVLIAFHEAFSVEQDTSYHAFLCAKDEPYVLWKILSALYGIWESNDATREITGLLKAKKFAKGRKKYSHGKGKMLQKQKLNKGKIKAKKKQTTIDSLSIIINFSDIRIKSCTYRPRMGLSEQEPVTNTFLITATLDILIPDDPTVLTTIGKRLKEAKDNCIITYGIRTLSKEKIEENYNKYVKIKNVLKYRLEKLLGETRRNQKIACPKEMFCPLATMIYREKTPEKETISIDSLVKDIIRKTQKISFNVHICVTGWESPAVIFQVLTLLILLGLINEHKFGALERLCNTIYQKLKDPNNTRNKTEPKVIPNIKYITSFSCINPLNSLVEIIFTLEENNKVQYPIIRNILFIPLDETETEKHRKIIHHYLQKIVKFLNKIHQKALKWPAKTFYRLRKIQGAYLISNEILGKCDIKYCPIGKRKITFAETLEAQLLKTNWTNQNQGKLTETLKHVRRQIHKYYPPEQLTTFIHILNDIRRQIIKIENTQSSLKGNTLAIRNLGIKQKISCEKKSGKKDEIKKSGKKHKARNRKRNKRHGKQYKGMKRTISSEKKIKKLKKIATISLKAYARAKRRTISVQKRLRQKKKQENKQKKTKIKQKTIKTRETTTKKRNKLKEAIKTKTIYTATDQKQALEELQTALQNIFEMIDSLKDEDKNKQSKNIKEEIIRFYKRYLIGLKRYLKDKENEILIGETRHLQEIYGNIQEHEEKLTELEKKIFITLEYLHYVVVLPRVFSEELRQEFEDRETASQSSMNLIMETGW